MTERQSKKYAEERDPRIAMKVFVVLSFLRRGIDFEFEGSSVTIADYAASESFCSGGRLFFTCPANQANSRPYRLRFLEPSAPVCGTDTPGLRPCPEIQDRSSRIVSRAL
jgi:hypothetical protein